MQRTEEQDDMQQKSQVISHCRMSQLSDLAVQYWYELHPYWATLHLSMYIQVCPLYSEVQSGGGGHFHAGNQSLPPVTDL